MNKNRGFCSNRKTLSLRIGVLFLLLIGLTVLGAWAISRCAPPPEEFPPVHTIFLPIIFVGPKPALRGVGLSGPYSAVDLLDVDWYYRWGVWEKFADDPRYVPMIPGKNLGALDLAVEIADGGSRWILGSNEPDRPDQGNMTPLVGAQKWRLMEQATEELRIRLASPAPSQNGVSWLWEMVDAYEQLYGTKPRFDAIAVHYYAGDGSWTGIRDFLISIRQEAVAHGYSNSQIWLTEFGGECWKADNHNAEIMRNLIPWMKSQSWMGRYAWFASMLPDPPQTLDLEYCSLTSPETGELTELGELYRSLE